MRIDLDKFKKSSVGTTVDAPDEELLVKMKYSKISWIFITFFGTTRMPLRLDFQCKKSREWFESVTDKKLIQHYMLYRRK